MSEKDPYSGLSPIDVGRVQRIENLIKQAMPHLQGEDGKAQVTNMALGINAMLEPDTPISSIMFFDYPGN